MRDNAADWFPGQAGPGQRASEPVSRWKSQWTSQWASLWASERASERARQPDSQARPASEQNRQARDIQICTRRDVRTYICMYDKLPSVLCVGEIWLHAYSFIFILFVYIVCSRGGGKGSWDGDHADEVGSLRTYPSVMAVGREEEAGGGERHLW